MLFICLPFRSHTNPVQSCSLPSISSGQPCLAGSISACGKEEEEPRAHMSAAGMRHSLGPLAALRLIDALSPQMKEQGAQKPCPKHARGWDAQVPCSPSSCSCPSNPFPAVPSAFPCLVCHSSAKRPLDVHRPGVHLQQPGHSLTSIPEALWASSQSAPFPQPGHSSSLQGLPHCKTRRRTSATTSSSTALACQANGDILDARSEMWPERQWGYFGCQVRDVARAMARRWPWARGLQLPICAEIHSLNSCVQPASVWCAYRASDFSVRISGDPQLPTV